MLRDLHIYCIVLHLIILVIISGLYSNSLVEVDKKKLNFSISFKGELKLSWLQKNLALDYLSIKHLRRFIEANDRLTGTALPPRDKKGELWGSISFFL